MTKKLININIKSILSLILCFVMLFSILAPTISAANNEEDGNVIINVEDGIDDKIKEFKEEAKNYEKNHNIKGEILDFSKAEFRKSSSVVSRNLETDGSTSSGSYKIQKSGSDYTITLENVTVKKIILPPDDADVKNLQEGQDIAYNEKEKRQTNITIILVGNNKVTGYGISGYPVKGIKIQGSGDLEVNAYSEPVVSRVRTGKKDGTWLEKAEINYYTKAGISVETGDQKYGEYLKNPAPYDDNNSLVFEGTGKITIKAPNYYGLINNGDIKFKSGKIKIDSEKNAVNGYGIYIDLKEENKDFSLELNSNQNAFYRKPTFSVDGYIFMAGRISGANAEEYADVKQKADVQNNYSSYRYINVKFVEDEIAPEISGDNLKQDGVYCGLPVVTVTDNIAIDSITVNGTKLASEFSLNTAKKKIFKVPALNSDKKEIIATDALGNESRISFTAHTVHQLSEPVRKEGVAPTCTTDGYHYNEYTCTVCEKLVDTQKVVDKALGHTFGDWETIPNGRKHRCSVCGYEEVEDTTKSISNTTISLSNSSYVYDGNVKEPTVTVKDGSAKLVQGKDYTVAYSNNLLAGTASVKITGINNYKNTVSKNFTITKASNVITASNFTKSYSSSAQSFLIGASQKGNGILSYSSDNRSVVVDNLGRVTISAGFSGKANITIRASETSGYESATKQITVTVSPAPVTAPAVSSKPATSSSSSSTSSSKPATSSSSSTSSSKPASSSSSSTSSSKPATSSSSSSSSSRPASKANNVITASNYSKSYSSKAYSFNIKATQKGNSKLTYSSNNKNVKVTSAGKVTIAKGFIGKATITITAPATSSYNKATKKITVTVNPPAVKISKLSNSSSKKMTIKWNKSTVVTGYQIQYSTSKNFSNNVKTVTITKKSTTSKTVSKLTKKKKYYVHIRTYKTVSGVKYYSGWSSSKNITIKK